MIGKFIGKSSRGFITGNTYNIESKIQNIRKGFYPFEKYMLCICIYDKNSESWCPYQSIEAVCKNWVFNQEDIGRENMWIKKSEYERLEKTEEATVKALGEAYQKLHLVQKELKHYKDLEEQGKISKVVRCVDCGVPHNKHTGCPKLNGLIPPPDFYCAFGRPRIAEELL